VKTHDEYAVTLAIREDSRLIGGTPRDPELIRKWIAAKQLSDKKAAEEITAMGTPDAQAALTTEEGAWTGFRTHNEYGRLIGLHIQGRQIAALIKEAGTLVGAFMSFRGTRTFLQVGLSVEPRCILLMREGKPLMEPDGREESAMHVMGPQGPRTCLKRRDYVLSPCELNFRLVIPKKLDGKDILKENKDIEVKTLPELLEYLLEAGGTSPGLGTDRTQGEGRYKLKSFEKVI